LPKLKLFFILSWLYVRDDIESTYSGIWYEGDNLIPQSGDDLLSFLSVVKVDFWFYFDREYVESFEVVEKLYAKVISDDVKLSKVF
jgi:hypothetical protein